MKIVDQYEVDSGSCIFTVEVFDALYVDVKIIKNTGLCYVMQNGDGSTVYGDTGTEDIRIGIRYDENAVLELVWNSFLSMAAATSDCLSA